MHFVVASRSNHCC